jgi:hypothetical protein
MNRLPSGAVPSTLKACFWILISVALLTLVTVGSLFWLPASVKYSITENYTFYGARNEATVYLGVLIPHSGPYQSVTISEILWHGSVDQEFGRYVDVLKFVGDLEREANREAVIEYAVTLFQGRASWNGPIEDLHLLPQYNIESDHPAIVDVAASITDGNSKEDAYAIYSFTCAHLVTAPGSRYFEDASALQAYQSRIGACGESANLMVALCRASGIPAQTIVGVILPDMLPYSSAQVKNSGHPAVSHAWVEYYTGNKWELADPASRASISNFLLFNRNDGRHLGFGEAEQLGDTYAEVHFWALSQGKAIGAEFEALKYIAAADRDDVVVTPKVTVRKGWDGRWLNLMVVWLITTAMLFRFNRKQVRHMYPLRARSIG